MAITVKKIKLWRREVDNRPGMLAATLAPLAEAGASLQVVMGYHIGDMAAIEVFPVTGSKATAAAPRGGLAPSGPPALLVNGDDRPALGYELARGIADAGINIHFLVAQVVGGRYSAVIGFGSDDDATRAAGIIKTVSGRARGSRGTPSRSARGSRRAGTRRPPRKRGRR
jgi:hypothetical protein